MVAEEPVRAAAEPVEAAEPARRRGACRRRGARRRRGVAVAEEPVVAEEPAPVAEEPVVGRGACRRGRARRSTKHPSSEEPVVEPVRSPRRRPSLATRAEQPVVEEPAVMAGEPVDWEQPMMRAGPPGGRSTRCGAARRGRGARREAETSREEPVVAEEGFQAVSLRRSSPSPARPRSRSPRRSRGSLPTCRSRSPSPSERRADRHVVRPADRVVTPRCTAVRRGNRAPGSNARRSALTVADGMFSDQGPRSFTDASLRREPHERRHDNRDAESAPARRPP